MMKVRFAPSPTGYLHIGGARTALYNYLYAKQNNGQFLLRIEDTDFNRNVPGAVSNILDDLQWLNLSWDNKNSEIYQSRRIDLYQSKIQSLIDKDICYFCDCSSEDLAAYKTTLSPKDQKGFYYHGKCRGNKNGYFGNYSCVRLNSNHFSVLALKDQIITDTVFGDRSITELKDDILLRSDGLPMYNFACPIDDAEMGITNVIRGSDHLQNTSLQVIIWSLLYGRETLPVYTHLPMMMKTKQEKLSKRNASVAIDEYRKDGYSSGGLLSYIARFGWRTGGDQELFSMQELLEKFDIKRIHAANGIFDPVKCKKIDQKWQRLFLK